MTNQTTHVTMRVTKDEAFEITILAANDKSVSAYIRRLIQQDKKRKRR